MPLFRILFILFLTIPLIEIYLFIQVGEVIGGFATIFLIVFTAVLGVWLLRWQGLITLNRLQTTMAQGELPAVPLIEGMMLLVAGALLLTPGFFTDTIGFILLVPGLRQRLAQALLLRGLFRAGSGFGASFQHASSQTRSHQPDDDLTGYPSGHQPDQKFASKPPPRIIEGEYERRDD